MNDLTEEMRRAFFGAEAAAPTHVHIPDSMETIPDAVFVAPAAVPKTRKVA